MRHAWLSLLVFVLPAAAQEYQVTITGDASQGSSSTSVPFDVTFDFNALSPTQSFTSAGGCLSSFTAMVPISGLSSSIGGQSTGLSATSMSFSGGQLGGGSCNALESNLILGSTFLLTLQNPPTTSLGTYPLVDLLQTGGPISGNFDGYNLSGVDVDLKSEPVGVPEPGTLPLITLILLGMLAVHRRRLSRSVLTGADG